MFEGFGDKLSLLKPDLGSIKDSLKGKFDYLKGKFGNLFGASTTGTPGALPTADGE